MAFPMSLSRADCILQKWPQQDFWFHILFLHQEIGSTFPPLLIGQDFVTVLMDRICGEMLHHFQSCVRKGITAFWLSWDANPWNPASMLQGSPAYMEWP